MWKSSELSANPGMMAAWGAAWHAGDKIAANAHPRPTVHTPAPSAARLHTSWSVRPAQPPTAGPLRAMAASPAFCQALVKRLRSGSSQAEAAAAKLAALVHASDDAGAMAVAAGAIPALLQVVKQRASSRARGEALSALMQLCHHKPAHSQQFVQAGGASVLLQLLAGAEEAAVDSMPDMAAAALGGLASDLPEMRQELGAAAFPALVSLLRTSGSEDVRSTALFAVYNL